MREIFDFIKEHWGALSTGAFGLVWAIVRLTPSEKDDKILAFIIKLLNFFIPDRKKDRRGPSL
jgi:hypothetical protein